MKPFIVLLLPLFLTACFKRNESHVNERCTGNCLTFNISTSTGLNSATPLGHVDFELGWSRPATPWGDPGRLIAKGNTSDNGALTVTFTPQDKELQPAGRYYVTVRKGNDYFTLNNFYYGIYRSDTIINARIHVPEKATLKLVLKNYSPSSTNDAFEVTPSFDMYGSSGLPVEMKNAKGEPGNTFFFGNDASFTRLELSGQTAGDQFTYFTILKKKNGIRTDANDSIYIAKGQTGTYEMEY